MSNARCGLQEGFKLLGVATVLMVACCHMGLPHPAEAAGPDRPAYRIYRWRGKLASEMRNDRQRRESSRRPTSDLNEWSFTEELGIGADGWIYHPGLLRFSADVGLDFRQDLVESSSQSELSQIDALQEDFNIQLSILPDKSYPLTAFATQVHSDIASPFRARRTVDTLQYGAGILLRQAKIGKWEVPTRLRYRHLDTTSNGDFATDRISDELKLFVDNETKRATNRLEYEWLSQESRSDSASQTYQRHDLRFRQNLEFGSGSLSSNVILDNTSGSFDTQTATVNEALLLRHSRTLKSNYGYALSAQNSGNNNQTSNRVNASVSHQLYLSLTSTAGASASITNSDLGTISQADGFVSLDYTKKIRAGRFGFRLSPSYSYQDDNVSAGLVTVADERHSTGVGVSIELSNFNIATGTIEVRDAATLALFTEGVDYNVVVSGVRVFLQIDPFGNIDPIVTPILSVRYDFTRDPARTFTTFKTLYGFNLMLLDHWFFDLSYTDTNQTLTKGIADNTTLSDETRLLAHLTTTFGRHRTRLDYERTRSAFTPRERYSATHNVTFRPFRGTTMGLGAGYVRDLITDTDRLSEVFSADFNTTSWLPYGVLARFNLIVRRLDEEEQSAWLQGASASLTYQYGRLRFQLKERFGLDTVDTKLGQQETITELVNDVTFRVERTY